MIFRRRPEPEDQPESTPSPAEDHAEELAELAPFDVDGELEAARRHLTAAFQDHGVGDPALEGAALADAVPEIAEEIRRPKPDVAAGLAEASSLAKAYAAFLRDHDLTNLPPPDRHRIAADALAAIERKRERIEQRIARPPGGVLLERHRVRLERELEQLDALEREHFQALHPPVIGGTRGGPAIRPDQAVQDEPVPRSFCRTPACGREISREAAYRSGLCPQCRQEYELRTGKPPPTI